jgi:hypothetical protein
VYTHLFNLSTRRVYPHATRAAVAQQESGLGALGLVLQAQGQKGVALHWQKGHRHREAAPRVCRVLLKDEHRRHSVCHDN